MEKKGRKSRENNIVIFELRKNLKNLSVVDITKRMKDLIVVNINKENINKFYPLGKSDNSPLKFEFTTFLSQRTVLNNARKLRGRNTNDWTLKQREDYKILKKHSDLAKANQEMNFFY